MTENGHRNSNLLFFLSAIMENVLSHLVGEYSKRAKYEFGKLTRVTERLNKELQEELNKDSQLLGKKAFNSAVGGIGETLNISIDAFNKGELDNFVEYVKKWQSDGE